MRVNIWFDYLKYFPKQFVLFSIRLYQRTLSLDHGFLKVFRPYGHCRFHPTCSEYGYQSIEKYGLIKGGWLTVGRVLRCHPWNKGGNDPVK
jgi:uncharacterized protein